MILALIGAALLAAAGPACARQQVLQYRIEHPTYGDIGTYTNIIDRDGDDVEVRSELRVAVKILGITFFRQDARRIEHWHDDRLIAFDGLTVTNGHRISVHGDARGNNFAITTASGTAIVPGDVRPSNPWSPMVLNGQLVMSTRTGKVLPAQVIDGEEQPVALNGNTRMLHQYEVDTDKRQFVWFDDHGVPVAFRTEEKGTPINFVLEHRPAS